MLNEDNDEGELQPKIKKQLSRSTQSQCSIIFEGFFYLQRQQKACNLVKVYIDQQKISYSHENQQKKIPLLLTIVQELIYLRDQKTVFALKLRYNNQSTILSTFSKQNFLSAYIKLTQRCILTGFQKHYRVGQNIGTGSFGIVYDGFNLFSNQNVALKVISKSQCKKIPNGLQMVYNQIRMLQKLKKYRISPLISTYQSTDCFIMVLQKGIGGNLLQYFHSQPHRYNKKQLKSIFKQVLQNLSLIHSAGIIHRDIKPQNILCKNSSSPSIFLCDYGISIQKTHLKNKNNSSNNQISGTLGYIAPQVINQQEYNQKCDIFSVGSLFYFLFTGKRLFDAQNYYQMKDLTQDSLYLDRKISQLNSTTLSLQIRDLLGKLLKFNQHERISANQALQHFYFKNAQCFVPNLGETDETLILYIEKKIYNYWN